MLQLVLLVLQLLDLGLKLRVVLHQRLHLGGSGLTNLLLAIDEKTPHALHELLL